MIYALTVVIVVLCVLVAYIVREARSERAELEDRLMSICQPVALIQHKAHQDTEPSNVTYVDEAREAELSPSWMSVP